MDQDTCTIDDFGPLPVLAPASAEEMCEAVSKAAATAQAIYPVAGRTQLGIGLPPTRAGIALDMRGLKRIIDYPARDMTITVEAGISLGELQNLLASEHQRLPIDVPRADQATLGGALATNTTGPRRLSAGTWRDYVIGITTINDQGQQTKAGGRVVKNVAGYDLCKLHIGALGTLGIITQVTLKLRPIPDSSSLLAFGCSSANLVPVLDRLHCSRTRPAAIDVLNDHAAKVLSVEHRLPLPGAPWVVIIGLEDNHESVTWQVQQVMKELAGLAHGAEARAGAATEPFWTALAEFTWPRAPRLSFKANMLPSAVADFCRLAASSADILLHAHAGSGIVRGHLLRELTLESALDLLRPLQDAALAARGNLTLPHCPPAWKKSLPIWGAPRGDGWLMRRVKEQLDPRGIFNPGRFIDGI